MPRYPAGPLHVLLNGRSVGELGNSRTRRLEFRYAPSWLTWEQAFAISASLPLREEPHRGDAVDAVFDNLLPDDESVRQRIATRTGTRDTDVLNLLRAIGRDCVGALQFLPADEDPGDPGTIDARPVDDDEIASILEHLGSEPLGIDAEAAFRISLAGAQEKTALLWHEDRWKLPRGTTATTHILKPPIGRRSDGIDLGDSVENEHFCLRVLAALDLPVAKTRVETFATTRALVVERFDRQWASDGRLLRRPQEDLCQACGIPPARKYEIDGGPGFVEISRVLRASDRPADDQRFFVEAVIANWLLGATDVHAKNFSLALHPSGGFRLAPLYDVVSLQPLFDRGELRRNQVRFALAIGDRRHTILDKIAGRHFEQMERIAGLPDGLVRDVARGLLRKSGRALEVAREETSTVVPEGSIRSIVGGYESRLEGLEAWLADPA